MLMIPVLFAMLFFVIEMGLYFTVVNYANYAAFVGARAVAAGFSERYPSIRSISDVTLTGLIWEPGAMEVIREGGKTTGAVVKLDQFAQRISFPFITSLMPNLMLATSVRLGQNELLYECVERRPSTLYDNNLQMCASTR